MADLSPAAQAVNTAVLALYPYGAARDTALSSDLAIAATALRAAADQVVPPRTVMLEYYERNESLVLGKAIDIRRQLLVIAAELEQVAGYTNTTETAP
jgi:hypothetical protein